jgi:hypothetical protein
MAGLQNILEFPNLKRLYGHRSQRYKKKRPQTMRPFQLDSSFLRNGYNRLFAHFEY